MLICFFAFNSNTWSTSIQKWILVCAVHSYSNNPRTIIDAIKAHLLGILSALVATWENTRQHLFAREQKKKNWHRRGGQKASTYSTNPWEGSTPSNQLKPERSASPAYDVSRKYAILNPQLLYCVDGEWIKGGKRWFNEKKQGKRRQRRFWEPSAEYINGPTRTEKRRCWHWNVSLVLESHCSHLPREIGETNT